MGRIIIVHGARACGKTYNARALADKYGCRHTFDGGRPTQATLRQMQGDVLILSDEDPRTLASRYPGARIVAFKDAMK